MRRLVLVLALSCLALPAAGKDPEHVYTNDHLGIRFPGVFGWEVQKHGDAGAWTVLARYEEPAFQAVVELQVAPNSFKTAAAVRQSIRKEFASGGYTKTEEKEVEMKSGARLKGIRIVAESEVTDEAGKKRKRRQLIETYFGKTRLYRVRCSAPIARYRRVQDHFAAAVKGLKVEPAKDEATAGTAFRSWRGRYRCLVPDGFNISLPRKTSNADIVFEERASGITITIFAYRHSGDLDGHIEQLINFYGDEFTLEEEGEEGPVEVLGGPGFRGRISTKKGEWLVLGTGPRKGRIVRIHQSLPEGQEQRAERALQALLKTFRIG